MKMFASGIEGAQHGEKGLEGFLGFAHAVGAAGCQPSNFMVNAPGGGFVATSEIRSRFAENGLTLQGISCHCPFWVLLTAWTGSPTIRPFISPDLAKKSLQEIEQDMENYILGFLDLCVALGLKVVPMFWGAAFGLEVASGYPWGFWKGPGYDLIKEGEERFVKKTQTIRDRARNLGIKLAHEIHTGTAAQCAGDFERLLEICDQDKCLAVIADPSHCWDGEPWQVRFANKAVASRVVAVHMKNHVVRPGMSVRSMEPNWKKRGMQFADLANGDLNLVRFAETMLNIGYPQRYCKLMGAKLAPLVVEAEGAFQNLDEVCANGVKFVNEQCCIDVAEGSFEDGMGAKD